MKIGCVKEITVLSSSQGPGWERGSGMLNMLLPERCLRPMQRLCLRRAT
jgi:hypothetical protein